MENKRDIIDGYLFELIERIIRFYRHLEEIKSQFYLEASKRVEDKLIFINSYKECLLKYYEIANSIHKQIENETIDGSINNIKELILSVNHLHKDYLMHLPRPSEPIELKRFARIIDKHVLNLKGIINTQTSDNSKDPTISIYLSEEVGEETYIRDPIFQIKDEEINKIIKDHNLNYDSKIEELSGSTDVGGFHISIPRIDANNPCRWPTLLHEVAHKVMRKDYFRGKNIEDDFLLALDDTQKEFIESIRPEISIRHWLIECWCDLFACIVTGPAFWFSQFSAFVFQEKKDVNLIDMRYPKALFRLKLIERILEHRFSKIVSEELREMMSLAEAIINKFDQQDSYGFCRNDNIRQLFIYFRIYFIWHFFGKESFANIQNSQVAININLSPLIKYTEQIDHNTIMKLVESLNSGFPIPGRRVKERALIEKPTLIQEILLSAWLYRNNELKKDVLEIMAKLHLNSTSEELTTCLNETLKIFQRFDKSILRSIQVSEWFDLLENKDEEECLIEIVEDMFDDEKTQVSPILSDSEIRNLLLRDELRIIPIICLNKQLGSTSFDIRLGTSFQVYIQTKYGETNFVEDSLNNQIINSKTIDLDFLESITVSPGQFVLGHSMEYLKLPARVAGQVDGRSSFARLGLQVHMTAGFIDPGFEGVLTFEISNNGPNPIQLFPGCRIAQIRFISVHGPERPYDKNVDAKYKGLLSHHDSKQMKDYEMKNILFELQKRKNTEKSLL